MTHDPACHNSTITSATAQYFATPITAQDPSAYEIYNLLDRHDMYERITLMPGGKKDPLEVDVSLKLSYLQMAAEDAELSSDGFEGSKEVPGFG